MLYTNLEVVEVEADVNAEALILEALQEISDLTKEV